MILEDPKGEPLERLISKGPVGRGAGAGRFTEPATGLGLFLSVAVGLATAVGEMHRRGIIHKNIKPAHVLVDAETGHVWLTGFGIASRLPRERETPQPPETIAGTLAYMAPEQTGRMNRSIDTRSDLYAVGVTLYEMLTGSLPFVAADPMEWVHCHIARRAVPPAERVSPVPAPVSSIIMKLLAKAPEDRYQTAAGLERDLRRCVGDWEDRGAIAEFPLGEWDKPDHLVIPEKLYGRAREVETLLAAFDRVVRNGAPELVLVSGYSGIGKSSVVNELHRVLVPPRALFAAGKFDQYKRDIPYSTLAQAFQRLVRLLLTKSDDELGRWRHALRDALGPNGQLMVDLVPTLKAIIGEQPAVHELPPQDAQRRFQLVFRRFLGVFARPEHPLALFLDDLQWLDVATLDLLQDLMVQQDVRHLFLIGAYRDNEVTPAHPLIRRLEAIRSAGGASVREIALAPLGSEDVCQLIEDSLNCEHERAGPLAQLVHEKTAGNPFFAIQFLSALVEEGLVAFEHAEERWHWDLTRIHAKGYTDNVVELMIDKLHRLPIGTRRALRQLACLGNSADIAVLAMVYDDSKEDLDRGLQHALRAGLIFSSEGSCCFLHDRVQEAAYALIPRAQRPQMHLRIGWLLAAHTPPEKREEAVFEIVNQLNHGAGLITSRDQKEQVAELNLIAGKRAKASTAYVSALSYLAAGTALLSDEGWERQPELMFAFELHRAECEFLTGELAAADARLRALSSRAANIVNQAAVACLRIDVYTMTDRSDLAVDVCLSYLRHLGIDFPSRPTEEEAREEYERTWSLLGRRDIEELIELPLMREPESVATLDVLTKALNPALFTDAKLLSLLICRMVNLSLAHGNSDASCEAYVCLGMIAGPHFGNYKAGFRFGRLGYDLVERHGLERFRVRTYLGFAALIMPWTKHLRTGRDLIRRSFDAANTAGDRTQAAYSWNNLITNLLGEGVPLVDVQRQAEEGVEFARKARFGLVMDIITAQLGLIRTLRGLTATFGCFDEARFDELRFERHLSSERALAIAECWYWIRKLQARFIAGNYVSAVEASLNAQRLLWTSPSFFETAEAHFYGALSHAACCDGASPDDYRQHLAALTAHHQQLEEWAANCRENFENRALLVGAEIARLEGRELDAERLYEAAIKSARANEFVQNEALANELAGRFYAARGFETISYAYLRNARYGYLRWGADGKVRQLDELHPRLRDEDPPADLTRTVETHIERLDLAVVLQVLGAVSGETDLNTLIATVMRLGLEHAGAERGLLILPLGGTYRIEAEARVGDDGVTVALHQAPVTAAALPESVFQYVLRSGETVLLHDAASGGAFSNDDYVRQHCVRSVLCMPLLEQARTVGILYLENRLTAGAFTSARMALMKLLASEAAISIENARLYRDLQEREARVRRLIDANIIGIFIWHADGRVFDANDELLRIIGYSREDVVSGRLHWTDFSVPESSELNARQLEELRQGGALKAEERTYLTKSGSRVPVLTGGTMFEGSRDEGVAFVIDLTERKRAEQALREREHESRLILDTIPGPVAVLTQIGDLEAINHDLMMFCGQTAETMKHWATNGTVHPDDMPRIGPIFAEAIATGKPIDNEARIRRFDGVYRRVQVRGLPMRDSFDRILRWYVLLADVEDRKRAEDALDQTREELARVARVMSLSALTASIAHEVNQPLSGIMTNASTCLRLLDASPPNIEGARETAKRTIRDGNRASDVIERLRGMFSKREFTLESTDLNEATREVISLSLNDLQRNRVALQLELADPLPLVMGDRVQLQQVILNLIRNASEAMADVDDRPRRMVVRTEPDSEEGVRVIVRDAGVGLDRQNLNKLFDAFHTTKHGGMGIGLSISRSIIERHHGRMWAEPNEGPGATFAFSLPRA